MELADTAVAVRNAELDAVESAAVSLHTLALLLRGEVARRICCAVVRTSEAGAAGPVAVLDP